MGYFKTASRNVKRNKWRSNLIILGISFSVAMQTAIAISVDSLYANFIKDHRWQNYTDMTVHSTKNTTTIEDMRDVAKSIQTIAGISRASTIITHIVSNETLKALNVSFYPSYNLILYGCELDHPDFESPDLISEPPEISSNRVIISNSLSIELGILPRQSFNLSQITSNSISGMVFVSGILDDDVHFGNLFGYQYIIGNIEYIYEKVVEANLDYSIECVISVKNLIEINTIADRVADSLEEDYLVFREKIISELSRLGIISYQAAMNVILLASFLVIILFIINVLAININERKKEFGILRSLGTSNFQLIRMLSYEILIYCFLGSLLGIFIGHFFSVIYLVLFNHIEETILIKKLVIKSSTLISSFITGIVVSFIAGIYPILLAITLPPVQNIHYEQRTLERKLKVQWKYILIVGVVLSLTGLLSTYFVGPSRFLAFEVISLHFIAIILILFGTLLIQAGLLNFLPESGKFLFWHSAVSRIISSRNIKRGLIKSSITILTTATALSFILMIGVISDVLIKSVPNYYNDQFGNIDIIAECYDGKELPLNLVEDLNGIDDIEKASFIQNKRITIMSPTPTGVNLLGIDPIKYEFFMEPLIAQTRNSIPEILNIADHGVIVSDLLMKNLNLRLNSTLNIQIANNITQEMYVDGIVKGNPFLMNGLYIYISNVLFDEWFPQKDKPVAKWFVINIGTNEINIHNLTRHLSMEYEEFSHVISIDLYSRIIEESLQRQSILFQLLFLESFFLVGVSQFVCILITTYKLERDVAIMRAMGLSKKGVFSMYLAESTLLGVTAILIGISEGIIGSLLIAWYISGSIPINLTFDLIVFVFWVGVSFLITLVSTSIPSIRSSNKSIVSAIIGRKIEEYRGISEEVADDYLLVVEGLKGYYRGSFGIVYGVDNVSLTIERGEIVGLAGESGCGKSTLAELITGTPRPLLHYEEGKVRVENFNVYNMKSDRLRNEVKCRIMSYVPQASLETLNPVKRIKDFIYDVVKERTGTKEDKIEVYEFSALHFDKVGLSRDVLNRYPHELSGGMKQRATIAISTLWNPNLLIIDEPTSALDVTSQKQMISMLKNLHKKRIIQSILFVSHDIATLAQLCDRCIIMYCGQIVESASMDDIINNPLHPYTKGLMSSIVSFNPSGTRQIQLNSIPGNHPDLRYPPPGCRFHPRCSRSMVLCSVKEPPVRKALKNQNHIVKCWLYVDLIETPNFKYNSDLNE